MNLEKLADVALIAAALVLLYKLLASGQGTGSKEPAGLQKVRAPAGFVYDYTIDGYSRVMPDGQKEYLL